MSTVSISITLWLPGMRPTNDRDCADCVLDRIRVLMIFRCALPQSAWPVQRWKFCLYRPPEVQEERAILSSVLCRSQSCSLPFWGCVTGRMPRMLDFPL